MKYLFLLLNSCASLYIKEMQIEDCATAHLKVLSKKQNVTEEYYEKVMDSCQHIYTGRP